LASSKALSSPKPLDFSVGTDDRVGGNIIEGNRPLEFGGKEAARPPPRSSTTMRSQPAFVAAFHADGGAVHVGPVHFARVGMPEAVVGTAR